MTVKGTNQRVNVIVPGKEYRASCDVCGWKAKPVRSNLIDAKRDCRGHRETSKACA